MKNGYHSCAEPTKVEYAIRPKLSYIVTRWDDVNGSEVIAELPSASQAQRIAFGLPANEICKNVTSRGIWSNLDEEFQAFMDSIDERSKANEALQEAATRQAVQAEMNPLATVGWLRQDMAAP